MSEVELINKKINRIYVITFAVQCFFGILIIGLIVWSFWTGSIFEFTKLFNAKEFVLDSGKFEMLGTNNLSLMSIDSGLVEIELRGQTGELKLYKVGSEEGGDELVLEILAQTPEFDGWGTEQFGTYETKHVILPVGVYKFKQEHGLFEMKVVNIGDSTAVFNVEFRSNYAGPRVILVSIIVTIFSGVIISILMHIIENISNKIMRPLRERLIDLRNGE